MTRLASLVRLVSAILALGVLSACETKEDDGGFITSSDIKGLGAAAAQQQR